MTTANNLTTRRHLAKLRQTASSYPQYFTSPQILETEQTMATQQTAETKYIVANGTKLAYRQLGPSTCIPLVMLMHFRYLPPTQPQHPNQGHTNLPSSGNMDFWDPALIDTLAKTRPILLLDNAGVGKSSGLIPTTLHGWATHIIALLSALRITQIDLLGFSMGGGAAQHVVLAAPGLVRKLILAGTRTSLTPQTIFGPRDVFAALANSVTEEDFRQAWTRSFFPHTEHGRDAAAASWTRIFSRSGDRAPHLSPELGRRQIAAFAKFSQPSDNNPYERIGEIDMPVLVANGDEDLLIPTANSVELARLLENAQLIVYEGAGHGFLFQYAESFARDVGVFLDGEEGNERARI